MSEEQAAKAEQAVGPIGLIAPLEVSAPAPTPDRVWELPGGTAWVYYGEGNQCLVNPVILADGFNSGPSNLHESWEFLERGAYPLVSELRRRGRDLVILGFAERSASILDNAQTAIAAISQTLAERYGKTRLTVGGFSMGGLVTRYALAKLEHDGIDHQTDLYVSYDSPHRGAWIPISLQAFAHFIRAGNPAFSNQINSPAARQLLRWHISEAGSEPQEDALRTTFLEKLDEVGSWPSIPKKIGVANGSGNGSANDVPPGVEALKCTGLVFNGTVLYTQSAGDDQQVAALRSIFGGTRDVYTNGLPEMDGAPGGTLESFGILADALNKYGQAEVYYRSVCFVPAVSAVAIRDLDTQDDVYADISSLPAKESELDEFLCATENEEHTLITEELCTWILDRLPAPAPL
ncbi:esterase/lipase family protein [Streptosporangium sp. NPDC000396]|uniref:esterase/lipase family protein n=1 Tax=Streptosporangium sp. NPDC000396 TaxID=3366185 RepID=UPI003692F77C